MNVFVLLLAAAVSVQIQAGWKIEQGSNQPGQGKRTDVLQDGALVARLIYGEGQLKPYLHVFGREGDLLTEWSPEQQFPHHRGIFIGWNRIASDLGRDDLWHLRSGEKMELLQIEKAEAGADYALIVAKVAWRGAKRDANGSDLLLTETRTMRISRPAADKTQVDTRFVLKAARDLTLDGDLQHAGVHFRGAAQLSKREQETSYAWEPDLPGPGGKVVSPDLKWCRLIFPVGNRWYSATELNAPSNPTAELSWRAYGRFGFFFVRALKANESMEIQYRFITQPADAPVDPRHSAEQLKAHRADAARQYEDWIKRN